MRGHPEWRRIYIGSSSLMYHYLPTAQAQPRSICKLAAVGLSCPPYRTQKFCTNAQRSGSGNLIHLIVQIDVEFSRDSRGSRLQPRIQRSGATQSFRCLPPYAPCLSDCQLRSNSRLRLVRSAMAMAIRLSSLAVTWACHVRGT